MAQQLSIFQTEPEAVAEVEAEPIDPDEIRRQAEEETRQQMAAAFAEERTQLEAKHKAAMSEAVLKAEQAAAAEVRKVKADAKKQAEAETRQQVAQAREEAAKAAAAQQEAKYRAELDQAKQAEEEAQRRAETMAKQMEASSDENAVRFFMLFEQLQQKVEDMKFDHGRGPAPKRTLYGCLFVNCSGLSTLIASPLCPIRSALIAYRYVVRSNPKSHKLNPDCIRAVMLQIEKEWAIKDDGHGHMVFGSLGLLQLCKSLPDYTKEDIFYTLYNLEQAGYIKAQISWSNGTVYRCVVNYMTYTGHEFLNGIRDPKHWAVIKSGINAVRNYSLDAINAIAGGITSAAISAYIEKAGV